MKNPLKDKEFTRTLIGCIVGGAVFLIIIFLVLCLCREGRPFEKCRGKRLRGHTVKGRKADRDEKTTLETMSESNTMGSSKLLGTPEKPEPIVINAGQTRSLS